MFFVFLHFPLLASDILTLNCTNTTISISSGVTCSVSVEIVFSDPEMNYLLWFREDRLCLSVHRIASVDSPRIRSLKQNSLYSVLGALCLIIKHQLVSAILVRLLKTFLRFCGIPCTYGSIFRPCSRCIPRYSFCVYILIYRLSIDSLFLLCLFIFSNTQIDTLSFYTKKR